METSKMKELAKNYYLNVSNNEVLNCTMSKKFKNTVSLKVFNPTFKSVGYIWIQFNFTDNSMYLCSEIGVHGQKSMGE
jgi:hypothetical protein